MRRRWSVRTVCIIALFFVYAYSAHAQEVLVPKMVLKERVFDFKEVKEGEVLEHTFIVLNQGEETLEIKKVKPG